MVQVAKTESKYTDDADEGANRDSLDEAMDNDIITATSMDNAIITTTSKRKQIPYLVAKNLVKQYPMENKALKNKEFEVESRLNLNALSNASLVSASTDVCMESNKENNPVQ